MLRKDFNKLVVTSSLGLVLNNSLTSCASVVPKDNLAKYWIWLRPTLDKSDDEWKAKFDQLRAMGIEAILPQIYSSNEALFNIEGTPTTEPWLERIIPIAHAAGLQVHAWMWTMPCSNPQILEEHPDWYVVNRRGDSAHDKPAYVPYYKFLCPRKEEVRAFIRQRVASLAAISDLDGIHLDYVRMPDVILAEGLQPNYDIVQDQEYPQYDYCYCDTCRSSYKDKKGIDPLDIVDPATDEDWCQFRYDAVVDLVNDYLVPAAKEKEKIITAAVFPNWESVRQQWHRFDLDAYLPMLYHGFYNQGVDWIGSQTAAALERMKEPKPIYSGLFLPHVNADEIQGALQSALDGGAAGFSLFSEGDLTEEKLRAVKGFILERKD